VFDSVKRYLIYHDNLETWELVRDGDGCCIVERSGQRAKLEIPLDVFEKTEDGMRQAENLSLAVARAEADALKQRVNYFWRPFASP
jgi:hypothetical protein